MAPRINKSGYLSDMQASLLRQLIMQGPIQHVAGEDLKAARDKLIEIGAAAMVVVHGEQAGCTATYFGQELYQDLYARPVERNVKQVSEMPSRVIRRH